MRTLKSVLCGSFLAVAALAMPSIGQAALFNLTSDHCTGGCLGGAASAGTITVTDLGGGTLSFSVNLNAGFSFVSTGFDADFGFNLVGNPLITYTGVTSTFTPVANPESAGSLHMDGTGFFEYGLTCTSCGNGGSNPQPPPLNFTIHGTGLTLGSLEVNAVGQFFAVDLLGNGNTGAVDASFCTANCGDIHVPEPAPLALLAIGLLAIVGSMRRRTVR